MGAFDCIPKPFNLEVLDRIVAAAVAAGVGRAWSPFGVNRVAPHARTLRTEEVVALIRNGPRAEAGPASPRRIALG